MESRRHLVCSSCNVWSHSRALVSWNASLVLHDSNLYVTFFLPDTQKERAEELLGHFNLSQTGKRLRSVYIDPSKAKGRFAGPLAGVSEIILDNYYDQLMRGQPIDGHEALPKPACLLGDAFNHHLMDTAGERGYDGQTFLFSATDPGAIFLAQFDMRHVLDHPGEGPALFKRDGYRSRYSHEAVCATPSPNWPVDVVFDFVKEQHLSRASGKHRFMLTFSRQLVPSHIDLLKSQPPFDDKLFIIGPAYAPPVWQKPLHFPKDPLYDWLGRQKLQSVVFVSYGSEFFPVAHPWQLEVLVDALIAAHIPFILSLASRGATLIDQNVLDKVKQAIERSGNRTAGWLDQPLLLRHPSISATFLHGGSGGIIESLIAGVPMLISPYVADQSSNAATVAIDLDAGWELFESRDRLVGKAIASKPGYEVKATPQSFRSELDGVLVALKGEEGKRKRAAAQRASRILHEEHTKKSTTYMDEFLRLCWPADKSDSALNETVAT